MRWKLPPSTEGDAETPGVKSARKGYRRNALSEEVEIIAEGVSLRVFLQLEKRVGMEFSPIGVRRIAQSANVFSRHQQRNNLQAEHIHVVDRPAANNLVVQPISHRMPLPLPVFLLTLATAVLGLLTL